VTLLRAGIRRRIIVTALGCAGPFSFGGRLSAGITPAKAAQDTSEACCDVC
jgi:hypothetical protein